MCDQYQERVGEESPQQPAPVGDADTTPGYETAKKEVLEQRIQLLVQSANENKMAGEMSRC